MGLFIQFTYGLVWFLLFIFCFLDLMEIKFGCWIWIWVLPEIGFVVGFISWIQEEHEEHFLTEKIMKVKNNNNNNK